ncbi:MAG: class I SAM-dependent methyltransferase [Sphingomonas sp.]|nr:class I SAM-dependent methyltransferase [Sphingomonas sp.]
MSVRALAHTPPLGHAALTPLYDSAIRLLTRERRWRAALVDQVDPGEGDRILDVGCGTGSLLLALARRSPDAELIGIDPDEEAIGRARAKLAGYPQVRLLQGNLEPGRLPSRWLPTKIVSSLVFHQVPLAGKRALLRAFRRLLPEGGEFHLADYAEQRSRAMRLAFRMTVQMLDGVEDTQPNADGVLEPMMREAGFAVRETARVATPTGEISLFAARAVSGEESGT